MWNILINSNIFNWKWTLRFSYFLESSSQPSLISKIGILSYLLHRSIYISKEVYLITFNRYRNHRRCSGCHFSCCCCRRDSSDIIYQKKVIHYATFFSMFKYRHSLSIFWCLTACVCVLDVPLPVEKKGPSWPLFDSINLRRLVPQRQLSRITDSRSATVERE